MELTPSVALLKLAPFLGPVTKPGGYWSTKQTSPGDSRPVKPLRNSSGQMREYGMGMLLVSLFKLPFLSFGTLTFSPGSTLRPRKAGRPLGTPTGLLSAGRFTPVSGLPGALMPPTGLAPPPPPAPPRSRPPTYGLSSDVAMGAAAGGD